MSRFEKTVENFVCEKCGTQVQGNGFTNHCPNCLWSKHVDINPGDRRENCKGLMKPLGLDQKKGEFVLIHKCQKCGNEKRNKVALNDNQDEIRKISALQSIELL